MSSLCLLLGHSRQAYHKHKKKCKIGTLESELIIQQVRVHRKDQPKVGTRKLDRLLEEFKHNHSIKLGRDALFELLRENKLLIRKRRRTVQTTFSRHWMRKYPNLIKGRVFTSPNTLWVSDITYLQVGDGFCYLSLVTDGYSRKILGYYLSKTLEADGCIKALLMALINCPSPNNLFHHSDRGVQYCCKDYVQILSANNIQISMTESGDPLENALAERVNGILKDELLEEKYEDFTQAQISVAQAINTYNNLRLHASCNMLTPSAAHQLQGELKKHWKNYYKKGGNNEITKNLSCVNQIKDYI